MLTFEFTGVAGSMTEKERLTSGMVGKQVQIRLSDDWEGLTCTAVFVAGDICRTAAYSEEAITVPADVLRYPFRKLLVGVCGTGMDDTLVIPTVLAEGPFVELGANPYDDPVAVDLPVWKNLQNQIGDLAQLSTAAKDSLVAAINELAARSDAAESNPGGYYTPSISEDGTLSWSNNMGLENPPAVQIRGRDGYSIFPVDITVSPNPLSILNIKTSYITTGDRDVQTGDFLLSANGCLLDISEVSASGVTASYLMSLVPQRGSDYWTEADKAEIRSYVDEAILGGAW